MKRFVFAAIALALAATPAVAANHQHGGGGHPTMHANRPMAHMSRRPVAHVRMNRPAASHRTFRASVRHVSGRHLTRHANRHVTHRAVHRADRHAARRAEHRLSAHRYVKVRRAIRARHRFHVGVYRRPNGWYAHHWAIGERLPRGWFARDYWLTDWAIYGLWAPIDGLIWVRVGPDAMLIDPVSGEVVAVDYGLFF